jgi:hypothetical protein
MKKELRMVCEVAPCFKTQLLLRATEGMEPEGSREKPLADEQMVPRFKPFSTTGGRIETTLPGKGCLLKF